MDPEPHSRPMCRQRLVQAAEDGPWHNMLLGGMFGRVRYYNRSGYALYAARSPTPPRARQQSSSPVGGKNPLRCYRKELAENTFNRNPRYSQLKGPAPRPPPGRSSN